MIDWNVERQRKGRWRDYIIRVWEFLKLSLPEISFFINRQTLWSGGIYCAKSSRPFYVFCFDRRRLIGSLKIQRIEFSLSKSPKESTIVLSVRRYHYLLAQGNKIYTRQNKTKEKRGTNSRSFSFRVSPSATFRKIPLMSRRGGIGD